MEVIEVRSGSTPLLNLSDNISAVDALAEFVWNALDAEAETVDIILHPNELGAPLTIEIRDNGHGIPAAQATDQFVTHGESWKREARFSPDRRRPLHGRMGRGRFLAYGIADKVEWRSVSTSEDGFSEILISGTRNRPNQFNLTDPLPHSGPTGTTVTMQARQVQKAAALPNRRLQLTARLAAALLALPEVRVTFDGEALDPNAHKLDDVTLDIDVDPAYLFGKPAPRLRVVEWEVNMNSKSMYLCDAQGAVVTEHPKLSALPPVPIHWTAYLLWEGFGDPELMELGDLHIPEVRHPQLLAAAHRTLADHLNRRFDEQKGDILAEWKAQGVYPYKGAPKNPAEEVEREVFDIVAVVASPAIGPEPQQRRLSLQLLQQATASEPSKAGRILNAVLDLDEKSQEALGELLERTQLTSIVQAAKTIADRSDFLKGLRELLYADESRTTFREVDQLHPLIVNEPWIFGDEWNLSLSEAGLTRLIRSLAEKRPDVAYVPDPIRMPDGKPGRLDLVFSRHLPESERDRHLVVELKRPKTLTMTEYGQINDYATAITEHSEVLQTANDWDFWLIGTEVNPTVRNQWTDPQRPGLTTVNSNYRIWVMTWGQLLEQAERRLRAFQELLNLASTEETSRNYLQSKYAQFIPPRPRERKPT
jgi:hypothetical protein